MVVVELNHVLAGFGSLQDPFCISDFICNLVFMIV